MSAAQAVAMQSVSGGIVSSDMSLPTAANRSPALTDAFADLCERFIPEDQRADWDVGRDAMDRVARVHPASGPVVAMLESDPALARILAPGGFQTSTGLGYLHLPADELLGEMLFAAWERLDLTGQRGPRRRHGAAGRAVVRDLRALATGDPVALPARIVWDGPLLDSGRRLHGEFGSMRFERQIEPPTIDGEPYEGLVHYTRIPVQITDPGVDDRISDFYGSSNVTERAVERIVTQVRLALLEDGTEEPEDSPYATMSGPPARIVVIDIATPWRSHHLKVEQVDDTGIQAPINNPRAFERRLNFYVANWLPQADLAGRRLAASANEDRHEDDALVDAVTSWESMVGASGESVLRVTASIAKLLRDNLEDREALQKELKDTYSFRSKIVHGAKDLTIDDWAKLRDRRLRATAIGAQTLRALLGERPDILQAKPDRRSTILLLE